MSSHTYSIFPSILLSSLTFASFTCLDLNATLFDRALYSIKACPDLSVSLTGVSRILFKYLSYMSRRDALFLPVVAHSDYKQALPPSIRYTLRL